MFYNVLGYVSILTVHGTAIPSHLTPTSNVWLHEWNGEYLHSNRLVSFPRQSIKDKNIKPVPEP